MTRSIFSRPLLAGAAALLGWVVAPPSAYG